LFIVFIGVDCGTQSTKAIVWNSHTKKIVGVGSTKYPILMHRPGCQEQKAEWWIDALVHAIKEAIYTAKIDPKEVKAIGVSGQQHGLVALDHQNQVVRDIKLWCDTEGSLALDKFGAKQLYPLHKELGIHVPVAFTIAKLLWLKQAEPHSFSRIRKILLPHDYINFWFTGNYRAESGDASGTGYFNTHTRSWSQAVLNQLNLHHDFALPELIQSHEPQGVIKPEIADFFGFNRQVIIASGGGDNMMAAIGTGNVSENKLTISLGTSGTAYSHTFNQVDTEKYPDINAFCSSTNGYLPLVSTMNVTSATEKFRQLFQVDLNTFEHAIRSAPIGSEGIRILPYLNGARLPNQPHAQASIHGLTMMNMSQENILRAVVEGINYNLVSGIKLFRKNGMRFKSATLVGGGANSPCWRQMLADITGLDINVPLETEAAALGAALQAQWCLLCHFGQYHEIQDLCDESIQFNPERHTVPNKENQQRYRQLFQEYSSLVERQMGK
jgi:xylulokinase